jgi:dTDP-4-amino-4,6-dideoxygalactose transaminase
MNSLNRSLAPKKEPHYPSWPVIDQEMIHRVNQVLVSGKLNYWTGENCRKFEEEYADATECEYAIALANGTLALELALYASNICSGDEVVVTSRSFVASASCVVNRGAIPIFADVNPESQNISADTIEACLSERTKAIIVVHLAGWPCDMHSIATLAKAKNLTLIEDCAQAHGAKYKDRPVGSFGDLAAFSFCQDKIITTGGEGGMLTTSSRDLWERAWSFKDHGKDYETVFHKTHPPGYRWLHKGFGSNYRMTEMQAAIGRVALTRLPGWVEKRRHNSHLLTEFFRQYRFLRITQPGQDVFHSYYKYYVFVVPSMLGGNWSRDKIMLEINKVGVPCFNTYGGEIYLEEAFNKSNLKPISRCSTAKLLGETCLQFLVHPTLEKTHIYDMTDKLSKVFSKIDHSDT